MKAILENSLLFFESEKQNLELVVEFNQIIKIINQATDDSELRMLIKLPFKYFDYVFSGNHFWLRQIVNNKPHNDRLLFVEFTDCKNISPAEKWVLEHIEGAESKTYSKGGVNWYKDDKWLFTQDFKGECLWVSFSIWSYLQEEFGLKVGEIIELLSKVLYDYTDNGKLKITL